MSEGNGSHEFQNENDGIHSPFFATYADAATRIADTRTTGPRVLPGNPSSPFRPLITEDINKIALQLDDDSIWLLTATTPTWINLFVGMASASTEVDVLIRKASAGTLAVGQAVYVSGYDVGNSVITAELAQADSDTTSPALGLVSEVATDSSTGKARVIGQLGGLDTSAFSAQDELYVSASVAGDVTTTRPTGATAQIQKLAVVAYSHVSNGVVNVKGGIRANALPNLTNGKLWQGNGSNLPVEVDFPIITPLSATSPVNVTKDTAAVGVSTFAARSDHKHDITTASAVDTGVTSAEGSATSLSRSDHTHKVVGVQAVAVSATPPTAGQVLQASGAVNAAWVTPAIGAITARFNAEELDNPITAAWAVNGLAPASTDSNSSDISVRRFDDTTAEGVGFSLLIPATATNMEITYVGRAETAPGSTQTVKIDLYTKDLPDNAAPTAWSSAIALTDVSIPTNENFQYDSDSRTLATWGLTAGVYTKFELVRDATDGGDTLPGDYTLKGVIVEFT